jgi:hypothetical protein
MEYVARGFLALVSSFVDITDLKWQNMPDFRMYSLSLSLLYADSSERTAVFTVFA